jgi:alkylation response protein AidB-like acyl-CoA dehydrogenase
MSSDSTAYALSEEHLALRESVRLLAEDKIAPYAAEVDEQPRYPQEARDALVKADLHAVHIPEEYGGAGPTRWRPSSSSRRSPASAPPARSFPP